MVPANRAGKIRVAARIYFAVALLVMLGAAWLMAEQFAWVGRGKARLQKAAEGGTRYTASVRSDQVINIDTGNLGPPRADLQWARRTRDQVILTSLENAMLAAVEGIAWEDVNAAHLGKLRYAKAQFAHKSDAFPFRRGDVLAIRTGDGRLAKLRILAMPRDYRPEVKWTYQAEVEWVVYPEPTGGSRR